MNLHRLDLNLLKSLDVLLAERNVTRAASRLNLSQPALSSQLKQLRALFGDPLLLPGSRGMIPTARALALQDSLREHLAQLFALVTEQQHFDPATAEHTFRIVASDAIHRVVAPELLRRLQATAPRCRLALLQPNLAALPEQMSAGEIDLALLTPAALPDRLKTRVLYDETFLCLLRKDHPAAGRPLDLEGFCALEHLVVSPTGGGFWGAVDDALAALGRQRRVAVSAPSFLLAPELIASSDLIATVPAKLAQRWSDRLAVVAPPCEVTGFSVAMGWHPRNHADPAQRWLREQVLAANKPWESASTPLLEDTNE